MENSHSGREHIDPRLLALLDASETKDSLDITKLHKGDVVSVQTRNTLYTLKIVNPESGEVLVNSNGKHVTTETKGAIWGTTLTGTGTMIKMKTIILGLSLSIFVEGIGELILSTTQKVSVNGNQIMPFPKQRAS